ncbi:MAG: SDR family NAD(P)-dependent oxidoreductase [Patescibacteria group bacterium]|nr:SDR family NAD(P)-dependent oxidoreductase [Patescibacteria group bacterium]
MTKNKGYYFGTYDISTAEYLGPDFSRRCFVFPGQGAAFPGMFKDQYFSSEIMRGKFDLADLLAKRLGLPKISDYIVSPDIIQKEKIKIVANMALFTAESALFDMLKSERIIPEIVTGHSFGEYAAIVASGMVSFEDMFDIVFHRELFCPPPNSLGFMVAVNASEKETREALGRKEYHVSNLNSPKQTVVSVPVAEVDAVRLVLEEKKIRHKVLSAVPQPYHSPYLNDVKEKIEGYIKNKKFAVKKPEIPLFSSVVKKLIDEKDFKEADIRYILMNQITTPVDFISQVTLIHKRGCAHFLELGPRKVFSVFVEDTLKSKEIKSDIALNFLTEKQRKERKQDPRKESDLFLLINKTIGKITGYEIAKISFEDRFQEDLGIDSIKKADILLTVLNESNISPGEDFNTSKFESIKDTVDYLEKFSKKRVSPVEKQKKKKTHFGRYVFSWEKKPLDDRFSPPVGKKKYIAIDIEEIFSKKGAFFDTVSRFLEEAEGVDPTVILRANPVGFDYERYLSFFRSWRYFLKNIKRTDFNLVLVSSGKSSPSTEGYAAFFKSVKKESPDMFFKHIHFSDDLPEEKILKVVLRESRQPFDIEVLYKGGERSVNVPKRAAKEKNKSKLNGRSVVIAIGGAKGITFSLIKNISQKYKPAVFLVGKSSEDHEVVQRNLKELKKDNQKIYYESLDARDKVSLENLFSKIEKKYGKIDMVINGAGSVSVGFLKDKSDSDIEREFSNKVLPAKHLLDLLSKYKTARLVNFSSIVSKYGSAGQSIYTTANELVHRLSLDHPFASVIHWPPWEGVGMTAEQGVLQKLNEYGASLISSADADKLFGFDLTTKGGSVYYMDESDPLFYGFSLNNIKEYESLLGKILDPFSISAQSIRFRKIFDVSKDTYLEDHTIKRTAYVPGAVGITMFLCLGEAYFKKIPTLKNIEIHNPIIVKKADSVSCVLETTEKDDVRSFSIRSNTLRFYAEGFVDAKSKRPSRRPIRKVKSEILTSSIYSDYYSQNSLKHGPIFRCVDRAFLDKDGNPFLKIDNSKLLSVLGLGSYDKLILWIDALFQSLGAVGLKNNLKMIPVKIKELSFFSDVPVTNYLYAVPSVDTFGKGGLLGGTVLLNENGETLLELKGVSLRTISEVHENKLKVVKYKNE